MSTSSTGKDKSRRNFLVTLGLGITAVAAVSSGLVKLRRNPATVAEVQEFPDEDSIFHPAQDPRTDPRRV